MPNNKVSTEVAHYIENNFENPEKAMEEIQRFFDEGIAPTIILANLEQVTTHYGGDIARMLLISGVIYIDDTTDEEKRELHQKRRDRGSRIGIGVY